MKSKKQNKMEENLNIIMPITAIRKAGKYDERKTSHNLKTDVASCK